jgi:hypothetical protein
LALAVDRGAYDIVAYFDRLIKSKTQSEACLRSINKLRKVIPRLKVFETRKVRYLPFSIVIECGFEETAKQLYKGLCRLANETIVRARMLENSKGIELKNVQDLDLKILNNFCERYIQKHSLEEVENDKIKHLSKSSSVVQAQQNKKQKKKKKALLTQVSQNPTTSVPELPHAQLLQGLNTFTKDDKGNLSWSLVENEEGVQYCLSASAGFWVGFLRDYFVESGLEQSWTEKDGLVLKAEVLHKHVSAHPELLDMENSTKIASVQHCLEIMLSFVRPVLYVLPWKVSASGYVAVVQSRVDNLPQRCHNLHFLLEHIKESSGLSHDQNTSPWIVELKDKDINSLRQVCVKWSDLRSDKLLKLVGDKNKVKELRRFAQAVGNLKRDIVDLNDFQKICLESESSPTPVVSETMQIKELLLPKIKNKTEGLADKKEKNRPKKQAKKIQKPSELAQAKARPQKKKEQQRKLSHVLPQPEERGLDPEKIPADNTIVSVVTGLGITKDYFRQTSPTKTTLAKSEAEPGSLSPEILQKEQKAWKLLDLLFIKMQRLSQAKHKYCADFGAEKLSTQQQKMMGRLLTGWHYVHAQICNLLRSRYQSEFVKSILFEHYLYDFERQYQRQKHQYFPPNSLAATINDFSLCFQDMGALQGALSFIMEAKYPQESSITQSRKLIEDWGNYIEREYTREDRNLSEIIKKLSPNEFGEWLFERIMSSTKHLFQTLTEYQDCNDELMREIIELEMRFVADRIGEFLKHIPCYRDQNKNLIAYVPFQRLSAFLDFCRCFRNPTSHTYERGVEDSDSDEDIEALQLEEPTLDIEALIQFKKMLQDQISSPVKVGLFSDQKSQARELPRRVRSYKYRCHDSEKTEHDISCLTRLRVREISNKILDKKDPMFPCIPFAVSEPILVTEKTDLHAQPLVNKVYKDLCISAGNEDQCLLLIPITLIDDSQNKASKPLALSMLFKRGANKAFELNKICYASITNKRFDVEETINSLQQKWIEVTRAVNQCEKPREVQIKTLDSAQEKDIGVLLVELLARLAEQHMHKDGVFSPFSKSTKKKHQSDAEYLQGIIRRFRQDHIRLWWLAGMQERYLEQVFKGTSADTLKKNRVLAEELFALDLDPRPEICYKDMKNNL